MRRSRTALVAKYPVAELMNCSEEPGSPDLRPLVAHIGLVGAGKPSELTDPVVVGQTQRLIHLQLSLAYPVEPDIVVSTLHHGLRFHHVLREWPVKKLMTIKALIKYKTVLGI